MSVVIGTAFEVITLYREHHVSGNVDLEALRLRGSHVSPRLSHLRVEYASNKQTVIQITLFATLHEFEI